MEDTGEMIRGEWEESKGLEFQKGAREQHMKCNSKMKTEKRLALPFRVPMVTCRERIFREDEKNARSWLS